MRSSLARGSWTLYSLKTQGNFGSLFIPNARNNPTKKTQTSSNHQKNHHPPNKFQHTQKSARFCLGGLSLKKKGVDRTPSNGTQVDPSLLSSALPPGATAPELRARIHALPESLGGEWHPSPSGGMIFLETGGRF